MRFKIIPDNNIPTNKMQLTNPLLVALFVKNGKTCSNPKLVKTDNEAKLILDYIEQNKDEQFESILSLILEICNKRKQSKNTLKS